MRYYCFTNALLLLYLLHRVSLVLLLGYGIPGFTTALLLLYSAVNTRLDKLELDALPHARLRRQQT